MPGQRGVCQKTRSNIFGGEHDVLRCLKHWALQAARPEVDTKDKHAALWSATLQLFQNGDGGLPSMSELDSMAPGVWPARAEAEAAAKAGPEAPAAKP